MSEVYSIPDWSRGLQEPDYVEQLQIQRSIDVGLLVTPWGVMPVDKPGLPSEFVELFGPVTWNALGLEPLVEGEPQMWVFTLADFWFGGRVYADGRLGTVFDQYTGPCAVRLEGGSILCDGDAMCQLFRGHPVFECLPSGEDKGEATFVTRISVATKMPTAGAGAGERVIVFHCNQHMEWSARLVYEQRRAALAEYGAQSPTEQRQQSQRWREEERQLKAQGSSSTLPLPWSLRNASL